MADLGELLVARPSRPGTLGGVPLAFDEPEPVLRRWASELGALLGRFERDVEALERQLSAELARETRQRVLATRDALVHNQRTIEQLFAEARLSPAAPRAKSGDGASLLSAWFQLLRDWGWHGETQENEKSLEQVLGALGDDREVGRVLVLGAGAGRLAYDLHVRGRARCSVLLDNNPFPTLVGRRVVSGSTLRLFEVPRNPLTPEVAALERTLRREGPPVQDFHFVLADARFPTARPGAFDLVLTPWYIDRVGQSLASVARTVYRALRPGGRWLNHGPLIYDQRPLAEQLTLPELCDLVAGLGFQKEYARSERVEYLRSRASSSGRVETVHTLTFRRDDGPVVADVPMPEGLVDPALPLERFEGLAAHPASNDTLAFMLSRIDGKRSVREVAEAMAPRLGVTAAEAEKLVLVALRQIFRSAHRDF